MAPEQAREHAREDLPGHDAPPAPPAEHEETTVDKARGFARARRTLIAIAVAAFAVIKAGKWAALGLWQARGVDQVQEAPEWALHHWLIVIAIGAAVFGVVFVITRFVLGKL
jgi:hypothetical protein